MSAEDSINTFKGLAGVRSNVELYDVLNWLMLKISSGRFILFLSDIGLFIDFNVSLVRKVSKNPGNRDGYRYVQ